MLQFDNLYVFCKHVCKSFPYLRLFTKCIILITQTSAFHVALWASILLKEFVGFNLPPWLHSKVYEWTLRCWGPESWWCFSVHFECAFLFSISCFLMSILWRDCGSQLRYLNCHDFTHNFEVLRSWWCFNVHYEFAFLLSISCCLVSILQRNCRSQLIYLKCNDFAQKFEVLRTWICFMHI